MDLRGLRPLGGFGRDLRSLRTLGYFLCKQKVTKKLLKGLRPLRIPEEDG